MKVCVSAPGKIILSGEHSVVYGKCAVALSLNLRTYVTVENHDKAEISLVSENIDLDTAVSLERLQNIDHKSENLVDEIRELLLINLKHSEKELHAAVSCFCLLIWITKYYKRELIPLKLRVTSELPIGAGLGSSASYSVCVAASLLAVFGMIKSSNDGIPSAAELQTISEWAYKSECIFHGRPSGIDNTICTYGEAVVLKNKKPKLLSKVRKIRIIITNTKIERNTKSLVASVRNLHNKFPDVIDPILESMDKLAEISKQFVEGHSSYDEMQEVVRINQCLLSSLGVSHKSLDEISSLATSNGLNAKLTGAGGGGCAFIILPPDIEESKVSDILSQLRSSDFECWDTMVGGVGVSVKF